MGWVRKVKSICYTLEGCTAAKNSLSFCPCESNRNLGFLDRKAERQEEGKEAAEAFDERMMPSKEILKVLVNLDFSLQVVKSKLVISSFIIYNQILQQVDF